MHRTALQTRAVAWVLFTVLFTAGSMETHRYYTTTYTDARVVDAASSSGAPASPRTVERAALTRERAGQPSKVGHAARARHDAAMVLLLLAQGARGGLSR